MEGGWGGGVGDAEVSSRVLGGVLVPVINPLTVRAWALL